MPASFATRRLLRDYHARILATSASVDRRARSQEAIARIDRETVECTPLVDSDLPLPSVVCLDRGGEELQVVWHGGMDVPLTQGLGMGSSLGRGGQLARLIL